jgi:hypothetical protein
MLTLTKTLALLIILLVPVSLPEQDDYYYGIPNRPVPARPTPTPVVPRPHVPLRVILRPCNISRQQALMYQRYMRQMVQPSRAFKR